MSKVVLITGSSSGIGAATARLFAKRGHRVAVCGTSSERVSQVVDQCDQLSPNNSKALALVLDLTDLDNATRLVQRTVEHYGSLSVLVNNVGIYRKTNATDKSSFDDYRTTMAVNLDSIVKTTMEALPHLSEAAGSVVFVSSVASVKPKGDCYAYRMSKAALSSYAKCLAIDAAPKVRVNIVSPGPVATPISSGMSEEQLRSKIGLLGRVGESDEIASTIYFLASDEASFVNGAELFVDGGYLLGSKFQ